MNECEEVRDGWMRRDNSSKMEKTEQEQKNVLK
jgi:hypothetical protein